MKLSVIVMQINLNFSMLSKPNILDTGMVYSNPHFALTWSDLKKLQLPLYFFNLKILVAVLSAVYFNYSLTNLTKLLNLFKKAL